MPAVKITNKIKKQCYDCGKKIKVANKEIKNGVMAVYDAGSGRKLTVFKCQDCFQKSQELKNYQSCEVYSRVVGYLRPVQQWNFGKKQEFIERKEYKI